MPYLNILYNNINRDDKKHLIIVLSIITGIWEIISFINIRGNSVFILSNYWIIIYPILYYYIGSYIREYQINISKKKLLILILTVLLITSSIIIGFSRINGVLIHIDYITNYNSVAIVILSVLVFLLIYNINIKNLRLGKIVNTVGMMPLDIYLFGFIVEHYFHPMFMKNLFITQQDYLKYFIPLTMIIYTASFLLAYAKKQIFKILNIS